MPEDYDDISEGEDLEDNVDPISYRSCKENILKQLISAAKKEREQFLKDGDEINKFTYGDGDTVAEHLDDYVPHHPTLRKGAQFVDVICSSLYEQNPTRRVEVTKWAPPEAQPRAMRMEEYLNYLPDKTDLKVHAKRTIIEAAVYGRGVIWAGWDKDKNIATAVFDSVKNFLSDPDAQYAEETNWKARIRYKPRWWMMTNFPEAKEILEETQAIGKPKSGKRKGTNFTTDTIEYYEIYLKIGLHNYEGGEKLLKQEGEDGLGDDSPKKYCVTSEGKILAETDWEVPLWRMHLWPCIELDFKEDPGQSWPKSPIWPGLSQLKSMNWSYRHMQARLRQAARGFLAMMSQNGASVDEEDLDKILDISATPDGIWDILRINATGMGEGAKVEDIIQEFKLTSNIDEFERAISFEFMEFEKATGLYGILFQGQPDTQMRSAAEVQFREKTARSRIEDMQKTVESWSDKLAKVQALYARFLSTPEDFAAILGQQGAQEIGTLIPPLEEEQARYREDLLAMGAPEEIADQLAAVQAEEQDMMLRQQNGIPFDEWIKEANCTIAGGSTRRKDNEEEKQVYADASNTIVPVLIKSGLPPLMALGIRIERQKYATVGAPQELLNDIDQAIQIIMSIPPPPPPVPPGGGGPQPGSPPEAPPPGV